MLLLLLQIALGLAFLGYLVLACYDLVRGGLIILSGLGLLAVGLTFKAVAFVLKKVNPAPVLAVAPPVVTPRVLTWKVVAP